MSGHQQGRVLVGTLFQVTHCWLLVVSSHGRREQANSLASSKGTNLIPEGSAWWLNHLPKAPPPNIITWELDFNICIWGRHKHSSIIEYSAECSSTPI